MTATSLVAGKRTLVAGNWRQWLLVVGLAVVLAELEALQTWIEHAGQPMHDRIAWVATAMLPPWLLMAALVPAVAALCRQFPLSPLSPLSPRWRSLSIHAAASLVFPVIHLGALALLHSILGDPTPLAPRITGLLAFHYSFDVLAYWAIAGGLLLAARARTVRAVVIEPRRAEPPAQLVVRDASGVHVVPVDVIDWIEARNYCARIHAGGRRHLIRESLNSLESRLDPALFARVHRSAIVRVSGIESLRLDEGRPVVVLRGGVKVPASKSRWRALKASLVLPADQSLRSASVGSTLEARRAGR